MHTIAIGYKVIPKNYIRKHSRRYAVYKYINIKIIDSTGNSECMSMCAIVVTTHTFCFLKSAILFYLVVIT